MGSTALRDKKTHSDKTKLNPAARDDTLRHTLLFEIVEIGASNALISLRSAVKQEKTRHTPAVVNALRTVKPCGRSEVKTI